ncbi:serine/threonine-protein phosphatase 6 regulatory ankyrin repeat subunit A-like isoform X2 [Lineus longissimus]|uniref:serine/threonine-protein phosphatase 6 regulatory ankyrin repeat subunit A-like isoform X2 n=1 Tax=Lineus longissimus TaxID=88925 RepID=UPI00315DFE5D
MDPNQELLKYSHAGNPVDLKAFLEENYETVSVNFRDGDDEATPLITLVQGGRKLSSEQDEDLCACCRILVDHGADVNLQDHIGRTALHWAVFYHKPALVSEILQAGFDAHLTDKEGNNVLHFAIRMGAQEVISAIVKHSPKELLSSTNKGGLPPLIYAVTLGNLEICEKLIKCGIDVDQVETNKTKRTALHYCLSQNQEELFCLLLRHGAQANKPDYRKSVIQRSLQNNNQKFFHLLLDFCPMEDLEIANGEGASPLMIACQLEKPDTVRELIEHKVDVNTRDKTSKTALHYCAENTETKCAELVLEADEYLVCHQDEDGYSPLHMAVIAGNVALTKFLLEKGANINCTDNETHTAVHWATVCGQVEVMDVLMQHGASLSTADIHQAFPVHYAAQMSGAANDGVDPKVGLEVLNKLIDRSVPVNCKDKDQRQPLLWAASAGSSKACLALIEAGADPEATDKDGLTAMHCAASRGHPKCIEALHEAGANVDCQDKNSCTPVFYAITLGHTDCTSLLLNLGANPNFQDKRGRSPAHCAAAKGCNDSIRFLMNKNANFWLRNAKGEYPVHEASQSGKTEIAKLLVEYDEGQHLSKGNQDGRTCLHLACMTNNLELCKLLLDNNANINAVMKSKSQKEQYLTPLDVALIKGNTEIAEYLKANGAASGKKVTLHAANVIQKSAKRRNINRGTKSNLRVSPSDSAKKKPRSRPTSADSKQTLSPDDQKSKQNLEEVKPLSSDRTETQEKVDHFMVVAVTASRSSLRSSRAGSPEGSKSLSSSGSKAKSVGSTGSRPQSPSGSIGPRSPSPSGSKGSRSKSASSERPKSKSDSPERSRSKSSTRSESKMSSCSKSDSPSRSEVKADAGVVIVQRESRRSRSRSSSSGDSSSDSSSSGSQSRSSSRSRSRSTSGSRLSIWDSRSKPHLKARSRSKSHSVSRSGSRSRSRSRSLSPVPGKSPSPSRSQSRSSSPVESINTVNASPVVPSETSATEPSERTNNTKRTGCPFQEQNRNKRVQTVQVKPGQVRGKTASSVRSAKDSDTESRPKTATGKKIRPKTAVSKRAQEIVDSVRQFEAIRRNAQDLHRLRRIQLYHGDYSDQLMLKKLMERRKNGGSEPAVQSVDEWEHYLCNEIKILTKERREDGESRRSDKADEASSSTTLDSTRSSSRGSRKQDLQRELKSAKESDQRRLKERPQTDQQRRQEQAQNRLRGSYKPDLPPEVFLEDTYKCNISRPKRVPSSYSPGQKSQNGHLPKLADEPKRPHTMNNAKARTPSDQHAKYVGSPAQYRARLASAGLSRYQVTPNQRRLYYYGRPRSAGVFLNTY